MIKAEKNTSALEQGVLAVRVEDSPARRIQTKGRLRQVATVSGRNTPLEAKIESASPPPALSFNGR